MWFRRELRVADAVVTSVLVCLSRAYYEEMQATTKLGKQLAGGESRLEIKSWQHFVDGGAGRSSKMSK